VPYFLDTQISLAPQGPYVSYYGEDLNFRNSDGNGPLHLCAEKGMPP